MKNATPHQGGMTTAPAVYRRREREHLAALASGADAAPAGQTPYVAATSERKQTGRRYGPPPENPPHPRMQAPAPMSLTTRREIYLADGPMTRRQHRQLSRMGLRHGSPNVGRGAEGKGRPTPKRRASR